MHMTFLLYTGGVAPVHLIIIFSIIYLKLSFTPHCYFIVKLGIQPVRNYVRNLPVCNRIMVVMFHSVGFGGFTNKRPNNFDQCKATLELVTGLMSVLARPLARTRTRG